MSVKGKKYGVTHDEADADDKHLCRKIVRTIMDFGVNEAQKLRLIGLLANELENRDYLQQISSLVKRLEEGDAKKSTLIME